MRSFAEKFIQVVSWLCFEHQWQQWELLIIAGAALILLVLLLRLLRSGRTEAVRAYELFERSPIIGVRLTDQRHSRREIRSLQKKQATVDAQPQERQEHRKTTRQLEKLNRQIEQFQRDIAERQQTEVALGKRIAELTASNEQLRAEIARGRQSEANLKQRLVQLEAAGGQSDPQEPRKIQPENIPVKTAEPKARSRKASGPLSVEELSHLAELGRRLSPHRSD